MERRENVRNGELAIDSVTGVEVSLPLAGIGGRSYAFVIDWHIRLLGAIAWWFVASMIVGGGLAFFESGPNVSGTVYFLVALLPAMVVYFLYHPVLEIAMQGRTPGKRMAGVRIVTREGATPGVGAILIRNVFRLIDALPMFYCLGLAVALLSAQHVRVGDLAAGTLLVYDRSRKLETPAQAFAVVRSPLDARLAELIDDLLTRWNELAPAARMALARKVLQRVDPAAGPIEDDNAMVARLRSILAGESR